tara:strand:- start:27207 stop:27530 length:324 start_codon:yes stop_codon:yes gene_type:complete
MTTNQYVVARGGKYTTTAADTIGELRAIVSRIQDLNETCCYHPDWIERCIEVFILAFLRDKTSVDPIRMDRYEKAHGSALSMPRVLMDFALPIRHELEAKVEELYYM